MTTTAGTSENTSADDFTYAVTPAYTRYDQTERQHREDRHLDQLHQPAVLPRQLRPLEHRLASATIWFTGTQLDYIAMKGTTTGYAEIWVDGVKVTGTSPINLYASPAVYQRTSGPPARSPTVSTA